MPQQIANCMQAMQSAALANQGLVYVALVGNHPLQEWPLTLKSFQLEIICIQAEESPRRCGVPQGMNAHGLIASRPLQLLTQLAKHALDITFDLDTR